MVSKKYECLKYQEDMTLMQHPNKTKQLGE
jgi:hypothetical protein